MVSTSTTSNPAPGAVSGETTDTNSERILALDGLRGIAASMVVIAHAVSALAKPIFAVVALHESPVSLLSNGGGGVHIFFVLSGYCLSRPASRIRSLVTLVQFYLRRIMRIHPPYVAGLMISWLLSGWLYDRSAPTDALSQSWIDLRRIHISPQTLQQSLLFPGEALIQLPVGWTLKVEALFSIFLPFLMLVAVRAHWLLLIAVSIPVLAIEASTTYDFLRFTLDFSFGIAIYCERDRLAVLFEQMPAWLRGVMLATGIALLTSPPYFMLDIPLPIRSLVLYCGGAAVIVMCAVHMPGVRQLLSRGPVSYLGRISYSVYLIHVPVIILLTPYVDHQLNFFEGTLFVFVSLLATYSIAPVVYTVIEEPAMHAGYWLSGKLDRFAQPATQDSAEGNQG